MKSLSLFIDRTVRPRLLPPLVPETRKETVPPSHPNVMRLVSVIIKLKSRQYHVEFLSVGNFRVSFLRQRNGICTDLTES